ncbi:MAG: hypothetical protein AB1352_05440 [Patescibacteria group bacterium]
MSKPFHPKNNTGWLKYTICVSGAAGGPVVTAAAMEKAREIGREIVKHGCVLVTGATTGIPYAAAQGAKELGGISIGLSPASSERDHIRHYHLPIKYFDLIIYTGFDYSGRNLLLTRSSDAVIVINGRIGTLNEFTIAFEDRKPIGVLIESGGSADLIKGIVKAAQKGAGKIIYHNEPKILVEKVLKLVRAQKVMKPSLSEYFLNHHYHGNE